MANGNEVTVVGNLARDPELRFTPSGAAVANFGVAVNRRWKNQKTDEWEEQVSFFDVVCWRELAENVSESLVKGSRVVVSGRLDQRRWETEGGESRSKVEIVAEEVAPSLRWATAQVTRNERTGGTENRYSDPRGAAPGPIAQEAGAVPAGGFSPEEEPF